MQLHTCRRYIRRYSHLAIAINTAAQRVYTVCKWGERRRMKNRKKFEKEEEEEKESQQRKEGRMSRLFLQKKKIWIKMGKKTTSFMAVRKVVKERLSLLHSTVLCNFMYEVLHWFLNLWVTDFCLCSITFLLHSPKVELISLKYDSKMYTIHKSQGSTITFKTNNGVKATWMQISIVSI